MNPSQTPEVVTQAQVQRYKCRSAAGDRYSYHFTKKCRYCQPVYGDEGRGLEVKRAVLGRASE